MAKVLLVDTNFSSAPIYRALLHAGHEVHVVGGNPADYLAKVAPRYWQLDYSDTRALGDLIDDQRFERLVPGCTDRSYESCVAAGRGRFVGLDGPEALSAISHKAAFRRTAARLGLPVPRTYTDLADAGGQPVIVKPVDSFSGKGITILREAEALTLDRAIATARAVSPSGECLIEEFVVGQLYSHSAFLVEQRVVRDFLVREDGTANQFVVDTSRVLDSVQNEAVLQTLRSSVEALASHLGLVDGLLHTQFIHDGQSTWLIELTRRCPGDLYSQLIELSTGFPYARCYAQSFLGQLPDAGAETCLRPVMRHTISVPAQSSLDHVRFLRALTIERYVPLALAGDQLMPSPRGRVAVMFCSEESQQALDTLYAAALRRELYVVSDGTGSETEAV